MPGSSIMCCAVAGEADSADRIVAIPKNLNLAMMLSLIPTRAGWCGSSESKTGFCASAFPKVASRFGDEGFTGLRRRGVRRDDERSIQRRRLPHLDRS